MTTAIGYDHRGASERLILNNPAQAAGAVWGCMTRVHDGVPEARTLYVKIGDESASLRDADAHILASPTLRFKRGCSLRSRPHACAGLLKVCASGTIFSLSMPASERLTLNNPAQAIGAVWGVRCSSGTGVPEARALNPSVFEEVLLSYNKPTLFQQGTVLLFKADPFMMFLLPLDIVHYPVLIVYTIRESRILVRPSTEMRESGICLEPFARKGLHCLHILSDRDGGRQGNENMHMVGHTANAVNLPMQAVGLLHDDRIELAVVLNRDSLLTPICAEHYMIERLDITHVRITRLLGKYCNGVESASLRDAVVYILAYPTLRFKRGNSLQSLPHACAGLLRVSASGTTGSHQLALPILFLPTLRYEMGNSLRSSPHTCAGLLRVSASGTTDSHHIVPPILLLPTLRFERGNSLRSLPNACAGLLKDSASGTGCRHRVRPCKSSPTRGRTRCFMRNTAWTRRRLHLLRA